MSLPPKAPLIVGNGGPAAPVWPFGPDFQLKLQKVLMTEGAGDTIMEQIQPQYFESPELRWMFAEMQTFFKQYQTMPSWMVLRHRANTTADPKMRQTIVQMVDYQDNSPLPKEGEWIRSQTIDWIRQNVFHKAFKEAKLLWDSGKPNDAMTIMSKRMDQVNELIWKQVDEEWFFDELAPRQHTREWKKDSDAIPTGIPNLDQLLNGGLSIGELGIWIAYSKGGKSALLMNHGAMAVRAQFRRVLHFVLEGKRQMISDRYDAWFSSEMYAVVKQGGLDSAKYNQLWHEYQFLKGKLNIRGMTDSWAYTAIDLDAAIKDLKKRLGWIPELVIVDYGDLVKGRNGPYKAEWESQKDSFRDLKTIANRGYAVWTASQANYPDQKDFESKPHHIQVNQVAGGKEKLRIADFVGSINATLDERNQGIARLWAALYRDGEANQEIVINTDLARMKMGAGVNPTLPSVGPGPKSHAQAAFGYGTKGISK